MQDEYRTVARAGVHETEINRSRFLCSLAPVATEEEAQAFVAAVRREHADATHNCYAYVIGADASVRKASDDGEPGGTAGMPMLQMLTRRDMRYVVAVVTRYYGGVKLGAGGLIRAYGGVVGEALDALGTLTRRRFRVATVTVDHQRAGKVQNDLRSTGARGARRAVRRAGGDRDRSPRRGRAGVPGVARRQHGRVGPPHARRGGVRRRVGGAHAEVPVPPRDIRAHGWCAHILSPHVAPPYSPVGNRR
ncbi:putative YigZ family protein [Streptomyces sp. MJP52]|nr:putative YigZ family protein [Streptomyces sp. MJP52]